MKCINTVIVVVGILCCLVQAVPAQTDVNQKENQKAAEEPKGEVDFLIEDLQKHGEGVLKRCLENCSETSISDSERVKAGQSIEKVQPDYPRLALAAHVTGEVVVKLTPEGFEEVNDHLRNLTRMLPPYRPE